MADNRTLDEFAGGDDAASDAADDDGDAAVSDVETVAPEEVSRVAATYQWSPEGAPCAACEETVEVRWIADVEAAEREYVCADCKEW